MASTIQYNDLIGQMKNLVDNVPEDEGLRKDFYEISRKLSLVLESPIDTAKRISFEPLQLAMAKVACNLDLFDILVKSESSLSVEDVSAKTNNVDPLLLGRILRYLASFGMIGEAGEGIFLANNITKSLCNPGLRAGIEHHFDFQVPCWQALPKYFADMNYQNPSNPLKTSFNAAWKTDLPVFAWAQFVQPNLAPDFNAWMSAQHESTWLDVFPKDELTRKGSEIQSEGQTPLFVDLGGGVGHQCIALKSKIPSINRQIVVQDLPHAITYAIPFEGVEAMVHDFFTEQPLKGASFYYMRNVLHDWPDEKCLVILKETSAALSADSVILIDEMILPNTGAHWQAAHMDIALMATLAAMERSERQWEVLFDKAGLKIERVYKYEKFSGDSVMVVVPKTRK